MEGGKGFDAVEAGLVERRLLLRALRSACSAGGRSCSTLEAHEWWRMMLIVVSWRDLFGVGFDDATALVRSLVLTYSSWPARS